MIRYLVFFLCIVVTERAEAQQLRIGPKFGAQLSRPSYDDADFYDAFTPGYGLGFNAGGVVNVKASDNFALHTELLYSRINKHIRGTDGIAINREQYNYLSAPILLRGSAPLGNLEVYLNAGPTLSYWLGGKGFLRHTTLLEEREVFEIDYRIRFGEKRLEETASNTIRVTHPNRIQLGLGMGTGVIIPMGARYLMVDLRYDWGHTNMAKRDTRYLDLFYNDDLSFANHSFSLSLAYLYELDLVKLTRKGKSKIIKGKGK